MRSGKPTDPAIKCVMGNHTDLAT
uniref:Uncharacterized protein n=1 Tax=Arundo donax TaxID=35708 RepID=A0A0A9A380_ARUDO